MLWLFSCNNCDVQAPTCLCLLYPAAEVPSLSLLAGMNQHIGILLPWQCKQLTAPTAASHNTKSSKKPDKCAGSSGVKCFQDRDGWGKWWYCIKLGWSFKASLLNCLECYATTLSPNQVFVFDSDICHLRKASESSSTEVITMSPCCDREFGHVRSDTDFYGCFYGSIQKIHILLQNFFRNFLQEPGTFI